MFIIVKTVNLTSLNSLIFDLTLTYLICYHPHSSRPLFALTPSFCFQLHVFISPSVSPLHFALSLLFRLTLTSSLCFEPHVFILPQLHFHFTFTLISSFCSQRHVFVSPTSSTVPPILKSSLCSHCHVFACPHSCEDEVRPRKDRASEIQHLCLLASKIIEFIGES